jgi:ribosomal protein S8
MFQGEKVPKRKAKRLARYLANDQNFLSHSRRVDLQSLRKYGAKVDRVEELPKEIGIAINRVHLTVMATLDATAAVKIFENSEGAVLIRMVQSQINISQPKS